MIETRRPLALITRDIGCVIPTDSALVVSGISYAFVVGKIDSHALEDYTDLPDLEDDDVFPALIPEVQVQSNGLRRVVPINIEEIDGSSDDEEWNEVSSTFERFTSAEKEAYVAATVEAVHVVRREYLAAWNANFVPRPSDALWCDDYFTDHNLESITVPAHVRYHEQQRRKYIRKNDNRRARKLQKAYANFLDDILIQNVLYAMPEQQAGGRTEKLSITTENRNNLCKRGLTAAEVVEFEKNRDFSARLFSQRVVSRMYRDALQVRTAKAKLALARAELDHRKEKLKATRERAMSRSEKYADQQSIAMRIAGGLIGGAAGWCMQHSINTITRMIHKTTEKANTFMDTLMDHLKSFAEAMSRWGKAIKLALYSGLVWYLWFKFDNPMFRGILLASFPIIFGKDIGAFVSKVFLKDTNDKPVLSQSYSKDSALPALIALSVLYASGIKGKPNLTAAAVGAVGVLPRTIKGIECVLDFIVSGVEAVLNVLMKWVGRPAVRFRKQIDAAVDKAVKNAWELDKKMQAKDYDNKDSPQMYSKCMDSFAELVKLIALYHENVPVRLELIQVRNVIVGHCNSLKTTLGRGSGFRQEPLSILIESPPGKGKTMNIPVLIGIILKQSGVLPDLTLDTLHQAFFTRPQNSDYFDGYHGQECYYIDDIFAKRQNPNGITQFDEVMAFYGNVTTMLNMAECEKKGMYPFNSSLLLMTTNARTMESIGASAHLLEPDAFKRRIDIHLHMDVKPQYQVQDGPRKGQLDYTLYRREEQRLMEEGRTGFAAHPWYIWEAWETTFGDFDYPAGHGRCFSTFVPMFIEALVYKQESHMANMDHLRRVLQAGGCVDKEDICLSEISCEPRVPRVIRDFNTSSAELTANLKEPRLVEVVGKYDSTTTFYPPVPKSWALSHGSGFGNDDVVEFDPGQKPRADLVARMFGPDFAKEDLKRYYAEIIEEHKVVSVLIGAFAVFIANKVLIRPLLRAVCAVFKDVFKSVKGTEQSNSPKPTNLVFKTASPPQLQGTGPGLWNIVYDQTFKLVAETDAAFIPYGQVIMVAESLAVMPHHFMTLLLQQIDDGDVTRDTPLYLKGTTGQRIDMTIGKFLSYPTFTDVDSDILFVNFNKGFRLFKNIINFFLTEEDYGAIGGRSVRLDVATITEKNMENGVPLERSVYLTPNAQVGKAPLHTHKRSYPRWVSYEAATQFGDCGAPLCLTDYRYFKNRFLIGMHVAGTPQTGEAFSTLIPQELCKKAYAAFQLREIPEATFSQSMWSPEIVVDRLDVVPFTEDGTFGSSVPLYSVSDGVSVPVKSALVKTQIGHDDLFREEISLMNDGHEPPKLVPMKLGPHRDPNDFDRIIYPLEEATKPFVSGVFVPDSSSFKVGLNVAMHDFAKATAKFDAPILTKEEAVAGKPELGLKSITRATSVGYPLCREANDKRDYFGRDEVMDFSNARAVQLLTEIDMLEDIIKQGYRPQFVCRDFLKDEVRKQGKSARLIAGTDLRYYILCRMYFGAFVGAVCRTHLKSGLCLGLNPNSEWGALRRKLLKPDPSGNNVWDGDFAGFDSSQMPRLLWDCLDYINNWYSQHGGTKDENDIRTILFMDLVYSRHITGKSGVLTTVIEWCKSLPSGHFLTSTINSMISIGLIGAGYVGLTGRLDFSDTSAAVVQGDDNLVSTSNDLVGVFNQVTLSEYLSREFNMVYTAGRKGEELKPVIGIDQVVFLQRRFAVKMGHDVCPIRPESFLSSMYYVHTSDAVRTKEVLMASAELALEELSMHDEKYWDMVAPKLVSIMTSFNDAPRHSTLTSAEYLRVVRSRVPSYI